MTRIRPKFDAPPVVETVLSVQFSSLPGFATAHAGWFWKEYLDKLSEDSRLKWMQAVDTIRLEDQFERFGSEDVWGPPFSLKAVQSQPNRTQLIRADGERMVQIQDTRFILNWKKQTGAYPSFKPLLEEFRTTLHAFESFSVEAGFGNLSYNQWEIVYVDHLKKGELWESARDWSKIFPGLAMPPVQTELLATGDETMSADWRFSLANRRGRMYISLRQLRTLPSHEEVLNITFVARGPVTATETWEQGFEIGHDAMNETFLAITSPEAQMRWKKG